MEYLILGMLIRSLLTGYELQRFIRKNLIGIYSHSSESVQTVLAKPKKGYRTTGHEVTEGYRRKKTFAHLAGW